MPVDGVADEYEVEVVLPGHHELAGVVRFHQELESVEVGRVEVFPAKKTTKVFTGYLEF